jgi:outer membrane immunogenic protein
MDIKKIFVAVALATLLAAPALAADMPLKAAPAPVTPASSWAGAYIGVEGGGGWAQSREFLSIGGATTSRYHQSGGLVGGTAGFNVVYSHLLLGFEADLSWANIDKTSSQPGICAAGQCFTNLFWLNTDRLRAGLLFGAQNQYLAYVTGGAIGARLQAGQGIGCAPALCGTQTIFGLVAGAGLEAMLLPKLSAKVEYLHADFGDRVGSNPGTPVLVSERNVNIVRAGLNWHL